MTARLPALDGVRAMAALTVVGIHFGVPGLSSGYVGVDVFFVLSGYLITNVLLGAWLKEERVSARSLARVYGWFIARRAARLVPALVAATLLIDGVFVLLGGAGSRAAIGHCSVLALTYTMNFYHGHACEHGLGVTWSLAAEEQFYFLWPWLVALVAAGALRGRGYKLAAGGALTLWALTAGLQLWRYSQGVESVTAMTSPIGRSGALFLGCALALYRRDASRRASRWSREVCAVVGVALLGWLASGSQTAEDYYGHTLLAALAATLLIGALTGPQRGAPSFIERMLGTETLQLLGRYSYSLYLTHYGVQLAVETWFRAQGWPAQYLLSAQLLTAVFVAAALYYCVEVPILARYSAWEAQRRLPLLSIAARTDALHLAAGALALSSEPRAEEHPEPAGT